MKIICIGRNYAEHAKELKSTVPSEPVFFCKPDTALLIRNRPFFIPDFTQELHYEVEIVVKINKLGKNISEKFAHTYYEEIGVGIDFTARDLQRNCIEKGLPWEMCKGFDYSAVINKFLKKEELGNLQNIDFRLEQNGKVVQQGNSRDMIFSIDKLISYVSKFMTLKTGDYLFTGTPVGVGPVAINDKLEAFLREQSLLKCTVK
jgi:acylpyruvate hydrolase